MKYFNIIAIHIQSELPSTNLEIADIEMIGDYLHYVTRVYTFYMVQSRTIYEWVYSSEKKNNINHFHFVK